jgi:hypothetical protein
VKPTNPPALATKLLESLVAERTSEALLGDLIEQYEGGRSRAWYWWQVLQALAISAGHEVRRRKLQSISAIIVGCVTALPLSYFSTSLAARFVGGYKAYLVFLPLVFLSAAASGWIVRRSHPRPMVVIYAGFCLVASAMAFAVYAWLPISDRMPMPVPVLAYFVAVDFIIGPLGVLAGGLWGSSGANDALASPGFGAP